MAESAEKKRYVKRPRKGDVIRTEKYGDVTVDSVIGYGGYLLATDADGRQHSLHRAGDEEWLQVKVSRA
jgi:hypothetical protein